MMRRSSTFALVAVSLSMASCIENTLLHSYKAVPTDGWRRDDTICFFVPQREEELSSTLTIGLRTKTDIGMRDVVLAVEQYDSTATICHRDTVRYPLTDGEGDALVGGVNTHQYEAQQLTLHTACSRKGSVRIYHLMTRDILHSITEVGIKIEKNDEM